jgi:hypothetical protein
MAVDAFSRALKDFSAHAAGGDDRFRTEVSDAEFADKSPEKK